VETAIAEQEAVNTRRSQQCTRSPLREASSQHQRNCSQPVINGFPRPASSYFIAKEAASPGQRSADAPTPELHSAVYQARSGGSGSGLGARQACCDDGMLIPSNHVQQNDNHATFGGLSPSSPSGARVQEGLNGTDHSGSTRVPPEEERSGSMPARGRSRSSRVVPMRTTNVSLSDILKSWQQPASLHEIEPSATYTSTQESALTQEEAARQPAHSSDDEHYSATATPHLDYFNVHAEQQGMCSHQSRSNDDMQRLGQNADPTYAINGHTATASPPQVMVPSCPGHVDILAMDFMRVAAHEDDAPSTKHGSSISCAQAAMLQGPRQSSSTPGPVAYLEWPYERSCGQAAQSEARGCSSSLEQAFWQSLRSDSDKAALMSHVYDINHDAAASWTKNQTSAYHADAAATNCHHSIHYNARDRLADQCLDYSCQGQRPRFKSLDYTCAGAQEHPASTDMWSSVTNEIRANAEGQVRDSSPVHVFQADEGGMCEPLTPLIGAINDSITAQQVQGAVPTPQATMPTQAERESDAVENAAVNPGVHHNMIAMQEDATVITSAQINDKRAQQGKADFANSSVMSPVACGVAHMQLKPDTWMQTGSGATVIGGKPPAASSPAALKSSVPPHQGLGMFVLEKKEPSASVYILSLKRGGVAAAAAPVRARDCLLLA
jgi:hypothetical protein